MGNQHTVRPIIGLMAGDGLSKAAVTLIDFIKEKMEALDMDLRIYLASDLAGQLSEEAFAGLGLDSQFDSIFAYQYYDSLDAAVLFSQTLEPFQRRLDGRKLSGLLPDIPILAMGEGALDHPGVSLVCMENYSLVEELISDVQSPFPDGARGDLEAYAAAIAQETRRRLDGEKPRNTVVPAQCVKDGEPEKVGSHSQEPDMLLRPLGKQLALLKVEVKKTKADGLYSSLLLRNLLASSDDNDFFVRLGKQFRLMGTKKSVIYLADVSIESQSGQIQLPECLYLAMVQTGSKVETYAKKDAPPIYKGMLPQFMQEAGRPVSYLNFLLFYQNVQYGMLCVEAGAAEADFYSMLAVDIGSALRYLDVFLAWGRVQTVLEKQNQLLDYAASHDELTGLYNRAGILARANMFTL